MDCDDNNANVYPGNSEILYNSLDDDCNALTLDDDLDMDGFILEDDCDDNDPNINPDAEEVPKNGIDEDCDGSDLISATHLFNNTKLKIYPNPCTSVINIEYKDYKNLRVKIYDSQGKLCLKTNASKIIDTDCLKEGLYLIYIQDANLEQTVIERIIKVD